MTAQSPVADLHRKSSRIFAICLAISAAFTIFMLTRTLPAPDSSTRKVSPPPVIIHLQSIPQTRQVFRTPAPPKPFIPNARPEEADARMVPEETTIEDTKLDTESVPEAPPAILVPDWSTSAEEEVFEFFNVEEPPKRRNAVQSEYPEMARRAGIEGTVYLKVLVNARGAVDSVGVQSGPPIFHKSAVAAARATTFTPARQNDKAVSCWVVMPFRFVMSRE